MARLKDIPSGEREMLKELPCPEFEDTPFVRIKKTSLPMPHFVVIYSCYTEAW